MALIEFFVPGTPAPAGSKKAFVLKRGGMFTGRAIVTDDCKRSKPWQSDIKAIAAAYAPSPLITGPVYLSLTFRIHRPRGHFGTGANAQTVKASAPKWPIVKPDVLKLARCVEDALTSVIWKDDAQIVDEDLRKEYVPDDHQTGVLVRVEELQ